MFEFKTDEVIAAFSKAKNMNAALKNFLKKEIKSGDQAERFIKSLREKLLMGKVEAARPLIDANMEKFSLHLLAVGRYAFSDLVLPISDQIVSTYADEFNATYERQDEKIKIKDKKNFERIVAESVSIVEKELKKNDIEPSSYLRTAVLVGIFEEDVLREVAPLLQ